MQISRVRVLGISLLLTGFVLAGCSSRMTRAPVEDRGTAVSAAPAQGPGNTLGSAQDAEDGGRPGSYVVKPGDTLIRIGLDTGQSWKDIARWNRIDNPNLIEVGQVIRVVAPGSAAIAQTAPGVVTRPIAPLAATPVVVGSASAPPAATQPAGVGATPLAPAADPIAPSTANVVAPGATAKADDGTVFSWPSGGGVLAGFDEARNKGLDLSGKSGDPVNASADGRVVYAGAGLRGYGNLIILKHSNTFLTAYAHNRALLVKEDQTVRRGQKIAEMGNTDTDRVKLHFEIRRQGKPVDPAKYLPGR